VLFWHPKHVAHWLLGNRVPDREEISVTYAARMEHTQSTGILGLA
jgi:hypothetical protein